MSAGSLRGRGFHLPPVPEESADWMRRRCSWCLRYSGRLERMDKVVTKERKGQLKQALRSYREDLVAKKTLSHKSQNK